jgi:hypothetical protein
MKKILRLVTTSVLTLTLVACGEASSSVSSSVSSTPASSSVSSPTSSFAAVSSITLTPAATNDLTQVVGSLKTVVIRAALNAGTNPATPLEWYVDNVRSNQTGSTFEFTPSIAGAFKVQAKVGATLSNVIDVTVGAGSSTITVSTPVWKTASQVEITGDAGAEVTVTGATLAATSYYDLVAKKYILNFTTPLTQGAELTVTMKKSGSQDRVVTTTYETRKVEVNTFKIDTVAATAEADGSYEVERPNILKPATGFINDLSTAVEIKFKSANLDATLVSYKIERLSAPTGADAFATVQSVVDVAADNAGGLGINLSFDREDALGAYVFRVTLGTTQREVTVNLVEPKATLELVETAIGTPKFEVFYNQTGSATKVGITPAANGNFEITKDYLTDEYKKFEFTFDASNISVPANLLGTTTQNISTPSNQMLVSLAAPGGLTFMRVNTVNGTPQQLQFGTAQFRNEQNLKVEQYVDSTTPVGNYVYTVRILQLGTEIHKETVTVTVKDPVAALELSATATDPAALRWESTTVKRAVTATVAAITHVSADAWDGSTPALGEYRIADTTKLYQWSFASATASAPSWVEKTSPTYVVVKSAGTVPTSIYKYSATAASPIVVGYAEANIISTKNTYTADENEFDIGPGTTVLSYIYDETANKVFSYVTNAWTDVTSSLTYKTALSAELLAHPTTAATKYFDPIESKLWEVKGDAKATDLTVASKALTVQKPTRTGLDTITVKINAELENFVSPANPTATLANSFVDTIASPNVVRDFVTYKKSYTGPMTLDAAKNVRDVLAAFIIRKDSTSTSALPYTDLNSDGNWDSGESGIKNRLTVDPQGFDEFMSGGATYNIDGAFEFPINFETPVGSYVFTLQVGALTETITVNVTAATPSINLVVEDVKTNKLITPASNVYTVALNSLGEAEVAFDYELFNMRPATATGPYTIAFSATTTFPDWSDTRSDTAEFSLVGDNDGVLQSRGTTGLNKVLHRNAPSAGAAASLVLDEVGDYSFSVTVGGATKAWTVRVVAFPVLTQNAIYLGTGTRSMTPATTAQTVVNGVAVVPVDTDVIHLEVTGTNVPAVSYYEIVRNSGLIGNAVTSNVFLNQFDKLTLTASKGIIPVDITGHRNLGINVFSVFLYNSAMEVIGLSEFRYNVVNENTSSMVVTNTEYALINNVVTMNLYQDKDTPFGFVNDQRAAVDLFTDSDTKAILLKKIMTELGLKSGAVGAALSAFDETLPSSGAITGIVLAVTAADETKTLNTTKNAALNTAIDGLLTSLTAAESAALAADTTRTLVLDIGTDAKPDSITIVVNLFAPEVVAPTVTEIRILDGQTYRSIPVGTATTGTYKWNETHFTQIQVVFSEPVFATAANTFDVDIAGVDFVNSVVFTTGFKTVIDMKVDVTDAINLNKFVTGAIPFTIPAAAVTDRFGNTNAEKVITVTFTAP